MIKSIILFSFLLFLGCEQNNPVNIEEGGLGRIKGKVVNKDGVGSYGVYLYLEGTNFNVRTDSAGFYCFYNVPRGKYKLMLDGYYFGLPSDSVIEEIDLEAGTIYSVNNISIVWEYSYPDDFSFRQIIIYNTAGSIIKNNSSNNYYYGNDFIYAMQNQSSQYSMIQIIEDTVKLQIMVHNNKLDQLASGTDTIVIFRNNVSLDTAFPEKGIIKTRNIVLSGMDTLSFVIGNKKQYEIILYDTLPRVGNYVNITTGKAGLSAIYGYTSSGNYIIIDSSTYFVSNATEDSVDWDILFVNDSSHDTCHWQNINPDWGVIGNSYDNPQFSGDYLDSYYDYYGYAYYRSDNIDCLQLQNGTYSVYVRMFDAFNKVDTAMPILSIQLGFNDELPKLSKLIEFSPSRSMQRGEVWFAGKLYLPDQTFNSAGQYILPKRQVFASKQLLAHK